MREDQIKHMVGRFLNWKLPDPFNPDNGISFKSPYPDEPMRSRHWPVGTNLLDASQAEAMVRHMAEGLPEGEPEAADVIPPAEAAGALMALATVYVGVYQAFAKHGGGVDGAMNAWSKAVANFAAAIGPILNPGAEADRG